MSVYADNSYCFSADTRICTSRVRGRFRQCLYCTECTEGFTRPKFSRTRTSTSTQSTRNDLRTAHVPGEMRHEFRAVQVRGEIKPRLHTVCVRKPSDIALLRVRGPNRRIDSHGSTCADINLFLAEFYQAGSVLQTHIKKSPRPHGGARCGMCRRRLLLHPNKQGSNTLRAPATKTQNTGGTQAQRQKPTRFQRAHIRRTNKESAQNNLNRQRKRGEHSQYTSPNE